MPGEINEESQLPGKRLPQHRLHQRLRPLRGRRNLPINGIRTGEECPDTADDLVLLGKGWEGKNQEISKILIIFLLFLSRVNIPL
jgi:hypothetical protein